MSRTPLMQAMESAVKLTAFECFQHAAKCVQMAWAMEDSSARDGLLAAAKHWRRLGDQLTADEADRPDLGRGGLPALPTSSPIGSR